MKLFSVTDVDPLAPVEQALVEAPDWSVFLFDAGNRRFEEVIRLRSGNSSGEPVDAVDAWSFHYGLYHGAKMAAALRVTPARFGDLDCQTFYPAQLVEQFRPILGSASRLCSDDQLKAEGDVKQLISAAWRHNIAEGIRIDLINTRKSLKHYYQRMGYQTLSGWNFTHPRSMQEHEVRYIVASSKVPGFLGEVFSQVSASTVEGISETISLLSHPATLVEHVIHPRFEA